jgi:hypothetical protein
MAGGHTKHPKCVECGKALYKSAVVGVRVQTADPYVYCRNPSCKTNAPPAPVVESAVVLEARGRIQAVVDGDESESDSPKLIGLTLALLAQASGHREMADQLIDEYDLTARFGIQKTTQK